VQDDALPQDEFGHGTAISGIIAANIDNQMGIAGIAPNVDILPLRVLNSQGIGIYSDVAAAIIYATDNGAKIINLSLGGVNASSLLQSAVSYATSRGVMVIAAAGNSGVEGALYPAAYPEVIAVGAVDSTLQRSSFSNYGPQVDIYAPGRDILATGKDGNYVRVTGTSFAAPHVAGVAALELAQGKNLTLDGFKPTQRPRLQSTCQ
jgi:thermitase